VSEQPQMATSVRSEGTGDEARQKPPGVAAASASAEQDVEDPGDWRRDGHSRDVAGTSAGGGNVDWASFVESVQARSDDAIAASGSAEVAAQDPKRGNHPIRRMNEWRQMRAWISREADGDRKWLLYPTEISRIWTHMVQVRAVTARVPEHVQSLLVLVSGMRQRPGGARTCQDAAALTVRLLAAAHASGPQGPV
jgi:hypothetical protein